MAKKKEKKSELPPCPNCGAKDGEEVECPSCYKLKRDCCDIAGRNVKCFQCEETS